MENTGNKIGLVHINFMHEYNKFARMINELLRVRYEQNIFTDAEIVDQIKNHHDSLIHHATAMINKSERLGIIEFIESRNIKLPGYKVAAQNLWISEN